MRRSHQFGHGAKVDRLTAEDWFGAQSGQPNKEIKEEIIDTALQHHLMTQYTSFVAVEEKIGTKNGQPIRVVVPVEVPDGVSREMAFGTVVSQSVGGSGAGRGVYLAQRAKSPYPGSNSPMAAPAPYPSASANKLMSNLGASSMERSESDKSLVIDAMKAVSGKEQDVAVLPKPSPVNATLPAPCLPGPGLPTSGLPTGSPVAKNLKKHEPASKTSLRDEKTKSEAAVLSELLDRLASGKATRQERAGLEIKNGEVTVKLKLRSAEDIKTLRSAGFSLIRRDKDGQLVGRIAINKLRNLAAISFVGKVEAAKA